MVTDKMIDLDIPWCFSDEHRAWRDSVRSFCEEHVRPGVSDRDAAQRPDPGLLDAMGAFGFYGLKIPEEFGGQGADLRTTSLAVEELARIDSSAAATVHVQAMNTAVFAHLATDEQRKALLPDFIEGRAMLAMALTEPSGGSDAGAVETTAKQDGDSWTISGSKQFISNSGIGRPTYLIVVAATGNYGASRPRVSTFMVPADSPGVTVGPSYQKLGWRSADTHPIFLDDVIVPAEAMLGEEGRGYGQVLEFLTWARVPIAAMSVGLAQGCLEEAINFTDNRTSFGKLLTQHQAVAFGVADLAAMTYTARAVTYDAAWKYDDGLDARQEAAICKLVASELANKVAYRANQLHGGYGFMEDYPVARHYRDARILTVGEGTSEVQRLLIARSLGLMT